MKAMLAAAVLFAGSASAGVPLLPMVAGVLEGPAVFTLSGGAPDPVSAACDPAASGRATLTVAGHGPATEVNVLFVAEAPSPCVVVRPCGPGDPGKGAARCFGVGATGTLWLFECADGGRGVLMTLSSSAGSERLLSCDLRLVV